MGRPVVSENFRELQERPAKAFEKKAPGDIYLSNSISYIAENPPRRPIETTTT